MNTIPQNNVQTTPTQLVFTETERPRDLARRSHHLLAAASTDGEAQAFRRWVSEIDLELEHRAAVGQRVAS